MMQNFAFHAPTEIVFGAGTLNRLGEKCIALGRRALVVCDPFTVKCGLAARVEKLLTEAGVTVQIYDGVIPNPTVEAIDAGAALARKFDAGLVIGLGGGSAMDTAKGVAVGAVHEGTIWSYAMGEKAVTAATLPVVAVSTTSGTGSQCTCFAVISNHKTKQKPGMGSPHILPRVAVVDPELMLSMPEGLTVMTGFDVFCHAVEAYTSAVASPLSDMYAEKALMLVGRHLPVAYASGQNIIARSGMALADTCAGVAIAHAVVTLGHVMAHVIGGHYDDIPHGEALFSIYREVLAFNCGALPEKERFIARCIDPGNDDLLSAYDRFVGKFRFENRLKHKYQSDRELTKRLAADTFTYMKGITELNPVKAEVADVEAILSRSLA